MLSLNILISGTEACDIRGEMLLKRKIRGVWSLQLISLLCEFALSEIVFIQCALEYFGKLPAGHE